MIFFVLAILSVCAVATPQGPRIIGGLPASEGQFPYLAQIVFPNPNPKDNYAMAGAIISDQWILSIAQLEYFNPAELKIIVGTNYMDDPNGLTYEISKIITHPKYATENLIDHNIGVIKVKGRIALGENVKTIELSNSIIIPPNLNMNFAAWGITNYTNFPTFSRTLQYITLKSITMEECSQNLPGFLLFDNSSAFCTEAIVGKGPCIGDGGAPIVYGNQLVGIDLTSLPCGFNYPSLFLNTGVYRTWINEVTGI